LYILSAGRHEHPCPQGVSLAVGRQQANAAHLLTDVVGVRPRPGNSKATPAQRGARSCTSSAFAAKLAGALKSTWPVPRATSCVVVSSLVAIIIQIFVSVEGETLGEQLELV